MADHQHFSDSESEGLPSREQSPRAAEQPSYAFTKPEPNVAFPALQKNKVILKGNVLSLSLASTATADDTASPQEKEKEEEKEKDPESDKDLLRVKVLDYFCQGDGKSYNDHFYTIDVRVEAMSWQLDRCILDFVELDRKLRKRYPRCSFASLPIAENALQALYVDLERNEKKAAAAAVQEGHGQPLHTGNAEYTEQPLNSDKGSSGLNFTSSIFAGAESFFGSWGRNRSDERRPSTNSFHMHANPMQRTLSSSVEVNPVDHMQSKVPALNKYLVSVMKQHELLVAEEFCLFFDQEASAMTVQVNKIQPLSIHDILLLNEPEYKCIVRKREEVTIRILNNQILLWRFNTLDYDIAFSVDLNGDTKVSYTRYQSHLAPVCGVLLVDDEALSSDHSSNNIGHSPGDSPLTSKGAHRGRLRSVTNTCSLIFDNSYAKLHTKKLSWSARVVSIEEYQAAKDQAMEVQKEHRQFEHQRHAFKRVASRIAASRSGVIHHTSSIVSDYMEEETHELMELQVACEQLTKEIETLSLEKIEANKARQVAEALAMVAEETYILHNEEVAATRSQLETLQAKFQEEYNLRAKYEQQCNVLTTKMTAFEEEKKHFREQNIALEAANVDLGLQLKLLEGRVTEKTNETQEMEDAMTKALEQADSTIDVLEKQLALSKSQIADLTAAAGAKAGAA